MVCVRDRLGGKNDEKGHAGCLEADPTSQPSDLVLGIDDFLSTEHTRCLSWLRTAFMV